MNEGNNSQAGDELEPLESGPQEQHLHRGYNLLRIRPIRALVTWPLFPTLFQLLFLILFIAFACLAWGKYAPTGVQDKLYAKLNLVQLVIWGIWWPVMVWLVVLLGRVWCAICPLELVSHVGERLGRGLFPRRFKLGAVFRTGFVVLFFYALIQMLVAGIHLHRVPAYTSVFLWGLLAIAFFSGVLIRDRAFCRGLCPVALLLNTYGRGGMLAVRPLSNNLCAKCNTKDCVKKANRMRFDRRSCPSLLNPAKLDTNADCLLCGQCIKVCPHDNIGLMLRPLFPASDRRESLSVWPIVLFVMLVSGFVLYELCTEWKAAQAAFLYLPSQVSTMLGLKPDNGWIKGVWTLFVVPAVVWSLLGLIAVMLGAANKITIAWRSMALPVAVVVAAGHMSKGLAKLSTWAQFLPLAVKDPSGLRSAAAISSGTLSQPAPWLSIGVVSTVSMVLVVVATLLAIRETRLAHPDKYIKYAVPILILGGVFLFLVYGWSLSG